MVFKKKEKAVVLISGGMDSCVTAAIAKKSYDLAFIHIGYGQKTQKRERKAFLELADYFKVKKRLVCNANHLKQIGGSSLTDKDLEVSKADIDNPHIPSSYVPFRNTQIISMAVSWAEIIDASKIFIGAVEEDSSGYPDCREEYFTIFNKLINVGTKPETTIEIVTPLLHMKKKEIVLLGRKLDVPFENTWSCYRNTELACGNCDSCALRLKGFFEAGFLDPLIYEKGYG